MEFKRFTKRNQYTFTEFLSTVYAFLLTKLFYRNARLIRRPFYLRGKRSMSYGKGLTTGHACRFDLTGNGVTLVIGENCELGDNVHIVAYESVVIGSNVLMASKIFISDTSHGIYSGKNASSPATVPNGRTLVTNPVMIGNNVWIGENVCVLAGARIGDGSIIGANAVVTGHIPNNCIAVGIPARVVKQYSNEEGLWKSVSEQ